ncbi:MAG: HEPN domain-containing protein [Desulfosalsimonadaceae bacterium]
MDQNQHIAYWLDSAQHDLEAAENLFFAAKYDWSLFLGHLVLEKALKAAYVLAHENELPPKTHNLVRLIQSTSIPVDEEMIFWLDQVNDFHLEARYPDYKNEFYKTCSFEFAEKHFSKIKETFSWIKSHLK